MNTEIEVLLIEDDEDHQVFIRDAVASAFKVKVSNITIKKTMRLALDYLATRHQLNIVVLDLNLSDSRGLESLRQVREKAPLIPIVVLTSFGEDVLGITALKEGAQDFLEKSNLQEELLEKTIRYSIERKAIEIKLQNNMLLQLEQFNTLAVSREQRVIDLKKEVNSLLKELGKPQAYDLSFLDEVD